VQDFHLVVFPSRQKVQVFTHSFTYRSVFRSAISMQNANFSILWFSFAVKSAGFHPHNLIPHRGRQCALVSVRPSLRVQKWFFLAPGAQVFAHKVLTSVSEAHFSPSF
jgi:hypothetical protein